MKKRNKRYIPDKRHNPVEHTIKLEKLRKEIDTHGKTIDSIAKSHDNHISYLGNFARHDIKNAMLSMDSIISTTEPHEFTIEKISTLTTYIEIVMDTIDNFAKLIPYNSQGNFTLRDLLIAVELLSRSDMKKNNIKIDLQFDRNNEVEICLPFQPILQMMNNLILNSINSLSKITDKHIKISADIVNNNLVIEVADNGEKIQKHYLEKIFEYGFSTTGGSGIGLYHAKYLCNVFNGNISVNIQEIQNFTKQFKLILPCKKQQ